MKVSAVIVAAGRGQRAGGDEPKQWQRLGGMSVTERTVNAFINHPAVDHVVLVLHPDDMDVHLPPHMTSVERIAGGADRVASVRAGLEALDKKSDRVLIHDVARPLVTGDLIDRVLDALNDNDGAAPALAVADALWLGQDDHVQETRDRRNLYRAQTPQGFHLDRILAAHRAYQGPAADDVEIAIAAGLSVAIVPGDEVNFKITYASDFARAESLLGKRMTMRIGNGYDVHRFGDGDHVTLCGVRIDHTRGLQGHSDADVGMHALTDAIYGALAKGDIGRHFPPSDPQWKGADSAIFLDHAIGLARSARLTLGNADITLVCEEPKIGPHATAMSTRLAEICGASPDQISVKATTSERLGFTGRGEGIAALATVTLVGA